jgi:hypothetical protein
MTALTRRMLLGSAAAVTAGSLIAPATRATAPATGKQAPGFYRYKIGDFEVTSFNDGFVKVPKLDSFVVNQPLESIQKVVEESFIPKDDVRVPFNPLLVNTGSKLVLFDTGFGDNGAPTQGALHAGPAAGQLGGRRRRSEGGRCCHHQPFPPGSYLGYSPEGRCGQLPQR